MHLRLSKSLPGPSMCSNSGSVLWLRAAGPLIPTLCMLCCTLHRDDKVEGMSNPGSPATTCASWGHRAPPFVIGSLRPAFNRLTGLASSSEPSRGAQPGLAHCSPHLHPSTTTDSILKTKRQPTNPPPSSHSLSRNRRQNTPPPCRTDNLPATCKPSSRPGYAPSPTPRSAEPAAVATGSQAEEMGDQNMRI